MFPSSPLLMRADASERTGGVAPGTGTFLGALELLFCRLVSFLGIVFTVGFVPLRVAHSPV